MTKAEQLDQQAADMRTLFEDFNDLERLHRAADNVLIDALTILALNTDLEPAVHQLISDWTDIPKWYA